MLAPLRSVNDWRFSWLRNVFLKSFQNWLNSVQQRQRNFSKDADQQMFMSWQTYEGLKISVNSIIEATQFPLWHHVKYVLTERFCKDPLENWFGRQRSLGSRKDNPSMVDFGYNNNAIRNQKHFKSIANGNIADSRMFALTDESLPCWKPKNEWTFKCKSWIKKTHQLLLCFSQNIAKHKLTAYLMYLCYLFSYLYKYLNRYWAN